MTNNKSSIFETQTAIGEVPIWEKQLLTIDEAALYTNIGQNRIAEMLRKPSCTFVLYVVRKKLVKRKEFEKYLS